MADVRPDAQRVGPRPGRACSSSRRRSRWRFVSRPRRRPLRPPPHRLARRSLHAGGGACVLLLPTHDGWISRDLILGRVAAAGRGALVPDDRAAGADAAAGAARPPVARDGLSSSGIQAAIIGGPALGGFLYAAGASVVYAVLRGRCSCWRACCRVERALRPQAARRARRSSLDYAVRRRALHPRQAGGAGRDLARPVRGAAGRRRRRCCRSTRATSCTSAPKAWACCAGAGDGRAADVAGARARRSAQPRAARSCSRRVAIFGAATLVFGRVDLVLAVDGGAVRQRRRRHGQRRRAPDAGAARHARRDARPRQRRQRDLHRRQQPARASSRPAPRRRCSAPVGAVVAGGVGTLLVVAIWASRFPALRDRDRLVPLPRRAG